MTLENYALSSFYGDDKYLPRMCAYCHSFLDDWERDSRGRKGYCTEIQGMTHHVDWCHKPEEIEAHKKAMSVYVDGGKNKHGHEHAYSGTPRLGRGAGSRNTGEYIE